MKIPFKTLFLLVILFNVAFTAAQQDEINTEEYGFQISEMSIPTKAPNGYQSVKSVALDKPLYPDKAYEVGFWIFGPQLRTGGYSFPIQIFPSNFMGRVDRDIFKLVESEEIMPKLQVDPPPNYTSKGYFKFIIRPDTLYNYITVALKVSSWERPPINLEADVTVTGIFVKPLPDIKEEDAQTSAKTPDTEDIPKSGILQRILIDSKKSYTVFDKELSIGLYDHRNIDKDRVTIYLNDEILVEDLELKKKKKFFKATLIPGTNTITLHAENLGEVAPNTAAIIIKNKSQEFMAVLESDLGASQYFTLIYDPN